MAYKEDPEKERERMRAYRAANLEKVRERERAYRAANREKARELGRNHYWKVKLGLEQAISDMAVQL